MQSLGLELIKDVRKERMKRLDSSLLQERIGGFIECPECHYIGKNKRFTGKLFENDGRRTFKCFACGIWRIIDG